MTSRLEQLSRHFKSNATSKPVRVTVTGAAGNIRYELVHMIGQGRLLGPYNTIALTLLELPATQQQLEGTIMELKDCAFPLLNEINGVTNYEQGFKNCEIAILVGSKSVGQSGMQRKDLLGQNMLIFKEQGEALDKFANKNVKVLVVGNPANTNALVCSTYAPSIPSSNFSALTRLDQNRATSLLSEKLSAPVESLRGVIIWGNHSATQFADVRHGKLMKAGVSQTIRDAIQNDDWVQNEFVGLVAKRAYAVIEKRKASSKASAASAICDHIHDWILGTLPGQFMSMAVIVENQWYGLPDKICFSLPCVCEDGNFNVVQGLQWDAFSKIMIDKTLNELLEEKTIAFETLK